MTPHQMTLDEVATRGMRAQAEIDKLCNAPQNQCQRLLKWFKAGKTITSFEAYSELGITQLARCIDDLQKEGYSFEKPRVRINEKIVCRYKLIERN